MAETMEVTAFEIQTLQISIVAASSSTKSPLTTEAAGFLMANHILYFPLEVHSFTFRNKLNNLLLINNYLK